MIVAIAMFQPSPIPPEAVELSEMFFLMIAVIALGIPLISAITRRWERPAIPANTSPDITARLERIEQAVEAVAIEVERIAEAQRFSAKLMVEQQQRSLPKSDGGR
jgi:hypothetical protein